MTRHPLGRQPNDPRKPRLRLARYQLATPTPATSADWLSGVATWPMSLNDTIGDCTAAAAGHYAQAVNWYGRNQNAPVPDADVLAMYEAISGYTPSDPATDVGATLQDALGYWRTTGVGGNTIAAFAQLDHTDLPMVRDCIDLFGGVYCGMNFPASAMTQFNAGQPWTVVKRSAIEGGHCVPIGAYDASTFTCVTWGQAQAMDVAFFQRYFDEVWVPIDLDWLTAAGYSPGKLDTDALNADFMALTGQPGPFPQSNPTPAPVPTPEPAPAPAPAPQPADVDTALAAAMRTWLAAQNL